MTPEAFIATWVAERTGNTIGPEDDLFFIGGIDSLDFVELLEAAETAVGLSINPLEVQDWSIARTAQGLSRLGRRGA